MLSPTVIDLNTAIHDRVLEFLLSESKGALLDVGAGDGTLAGRLLDAGFDVKAVDLVTRDFRPKDIEIRSANLNDRIPYDNQEFDFVVATEVIEHLENPWHFMRDLYRITKPGGVVIVSTPNLSNIFTRAWYALTGRLYNFLDNSYRDIGHITPVYLWNLERMAENKFVVEAISVNGCPVPKTRFRLPGRSLLLGQCIVVKLRRQSGVAVAEPSTWINSRVTRASSQCASLPAA